MRLLCSLHKLFNNVMHTWNCGSSWYIIVLELYLTAAVRHSEHKTRNMGNLSMKYSWQMHLSNIFYWEFGKHIMLEIVNRCLKWCFWVISGVRPGNSEVQGPFWKANNYFSTINGFLDIILFFLFKNNVLEILEIGTSSVDWAKLSRVLPEDGHRVQCLKQKKREAIE